MAAVAMAAVMVNLSLFLEVGVSPRLFLLATALSALSAAPSATLTPGAPPMKGKWSAEERQTIMDTLRTYSSMSFKSLRAMLDAKYDIQISESMLGKMRREAS
jgi:hypothetical protein